MSAINYLYCPKCKEKTDNWIYASILNSTKFCVKCGTALATCVKESEEFYNESSSTVVHLLGCSSCTYGNFENTLAFCTKHRLIIKRYTRPCVNFKRR